MWIPTPASGRTDVSAGEIMCLPRCPGGLRVIEQSLFSAVHKSCCGPFLPSPNVINSTASGGEADMNSDIGNPALLTQSCPKLLRTLKDVVSPTAAAYGVGIRAEGDSRYYRKDGRAQRADWHRSVTDGCGWFLLGAWPTSSSFERFYGTVFRSRSGGKWIRSVACPEADFESKQVMRAIRLSCAIEDRYGVMA